MIAPAVSGAVPGPAFAAALGVRLREIRQAAGLSQEELAHMMGRELSYYAHLSRLEHGRFKYVLVPLAVGFPVYEAVAVTIVLLRGLT